MNNGGDTMRALHHIVDCRTVHPGNIRSGAEGTHHRDLAHTMFKMAECECRIANYHHALKLSHLFFKRQFRE